MRVLILGSDTPLGIALLYRQAIVGRHDIVPMSRSACRWKSERQAKKSIVRAKSDVVVDVRIEAAGDSGSPIQETDLQRCHWVAKACQRTDTAYLYVSSSRVFSGQLDRPYKEADDPDNEEPTGQLLARAEKLVTETAARHLILRLGPIFSSEGINLITRMLDPLREGGSLILDNNLRGSPVAADDGARVVLAVLDQLGTGLEPWGIYHYGSSDKATYYEFAEALLASASQFFELSSSVVQLGAEPDGMRSLDRTLDCSKIRNTFAIQQVSWRSAISDLIKHVYQQQQEVNHG
ncbi:MAG: sugar nucleotide-binding protein [Halioglobus sp.]|nr:sugar nucleotide-binding protein [Halioglobus sp.]